MIFNSSSASSNNQAAPTTPVIVQQSRHLLLPGTWQRRGLFVIIGLLVGSSFYQISTLNHVQRELAHKVQASDSLAQEARTFAKEANYAVRDIQDRIAHIEDRIATSQSQQVALEQLYRDLSQSHDDWILTEVEQTLQVANQQFQLTGNVAATLTAWQSADSRLARVNRPQYLAVRQALAQDMEQLKLLPVVDLAGLALKLDNLVSAIDKLPLLVDAQTTLGQAASQQVSQSERTSLSPPPASPTYQGEAAWREFWWRTKAVLAQAGEKIWSQIRQLIRVHEVSDPDALLLSPSQAYWARENFKLRLLNARLALMARNETLFRTDIRLAQEYLQRYFDSREKSVNVVAQQLAMLANSTLSIQLPSLHGSLSAMRKLSGSVTPLTKSP